MNGYFFDTFMVASLLWVVTIEGADRIFTLLFSSAMLNIAENPCSFIENTNAFSPESFSEPTEVLPLHPRGVTLPSDDVLETVE